MLIIITIVVVVVITGREHHSLGKSISIKATLEQGLWDNTETENTKLRCD